MEGTLKIYYYQGCPYCVSVITLAKSTKIPFEAVHIDITKDEHKTPEYTKVNQFQKVPALVEPDGYTLIESSTILRYLAKTHDIGDNWYPKDARKSGLVDRAVDWQKGVTSTLFEYFTAVITRDYKTTVEEAKESVTNVLKQVETIFLENSSYLAGNEISIADLAFIPHLLRIKTAKFTFTDLPKVNEYVTKLENDASLKEELEKWTAQVADQMAKKKAQYLREDAERKKRD